MTTDKETRFLTASNGASDSSTKGLFAHRPICARNPSRSITLFSCTLAAVNAKLWPSPLNATIFA